MNNSELEAAKFELLRQIYENPLVLIGTELRYLFELRYEWRRIEQEEGKINGIGANEVPNNKVDHITRDCLDGCLKARLLLEEDVIEAIRDKIREEMSNFDNLSDDDKSKVMNNLANWIFINQMLLKDIKYGFIKIDLEFLTADQDLDEMDPTFASIISEKEPDDSSVWTDIEAAIADILQQMNPTELLTVLELAEVENMAEDEALDNKLYSDVLCSKIADINESDLIRYYEDMDSFITEFDNLKSELKKRLMETDGFFAPLYLYFADLGDAELNNFLFDIASERDIAETLSNAILIMDKNGELKGKVLKRLKGLNTIQFLTFILEIYRMKVDELDDEVLVIIQDKVSNLSSLDRQALREVFKDESEKNQIRAILNQLDENEPQIPETEITKRVEQFNLLGGVKQSFPMLKFSPNSIPAVLRIIQDDEDEISDDGSMDYDASEEKQDPYAGIDESFYQEIMRTFQEREQCIKLLKQLEQLSDKQIIVSALEIAKRVDERTLQDIDRIGTLEFSVNYLKNRIFCMERKDVLLLMGMLLQNGIDFDNVFVRTTGFVLQEYKEHNNKAENSGNGDGR